MKPAVTILLVLMGAAPALGQSALRWCNATMWGPVAQAATWSKQYRAAYDVLGAGDVASAKKAKKQARRLLDDLLDACVSGPDGARMLSFATYLLVVAEQRLGESDAASWHWQMAQFLAPELREPPGDYPDVEAFLRAHSTSAKRWELLRERARGEPITMSLGPGDRDIPPEALKDHVTPPALAHSAKPKRPSVGCGRNGLGVTIVETYIDKTGIPREPTIYQGSGLLVLDVAAMEAVGQWRYKPALFAGKPIEVWFYPRVEFR